MKEKLDITIWNLRAHVVVDPTGSKSERTHKSIIAAFLFISLISFSLFSRKKAYL
jgi:hypothetical protein